MNQAPPQTNSALETNFSVQTHPHVDVLAADSHVLVVDKPAGLLSVPGKNDYDSIVSRMKHEFQEAHAAHRLDMATSGVMVLARSKQALRHLNAQFAEKRTQKSYIAEVFGLLEHDTGVIDAPLKCDWPNRPRQIIAADGKPSETRYRVIKRNRKTNTTRVALSPITGRSHQLRVHLQSIEHPILGDEFYAHDIARAMASRLLLHASELSFTHPATGQVLCFKTKPTF